MEYPLILYVGIPKPKYKVTKLTLSKGEKRAYNTLVGFVRTNLVITGLDPNNPGERHLDSLLNSRNKKALNEVITNLRLATCGAGEISISTIIVFLLFI